MDEDLMSDGMPAIKPGKGDKAKFDADAFKSKNVTHLQFYNDFDDVCAE
jgi:hypothetical protein